jgi:hypothetical protein
MHIKAKSLIVEWDGTRVVVINPGESDELPDAMAQTYIDSGHAEPATEKSQLDHDRNGKPGGSLPVGEDPDALGDARKRYRAAFGKNAGPRWTVEQIEAKIAEHAADNPPADDADDDEDVAEAPPSD